MITVIRHLPCKSAALDIAEELHTTDLFRTERLGPKHYPFIFAHIPVIVSE